MKKFFNLLLILIVLLLGCTSKKSLDKLPPSSLIGSCEKNIHLFEKKSKWVIEKERAYIHFEYEDEYPSKKAFYYLEKQLLKCGWKLYKGDIETFQGSTDWVKYIKAGPDNKSELVHHFIKYYTDKLKEKIASILLIYFSQSSNIEELDNLCEPNNNKQNITVQIIRFGEKEYKKLKELMEGQLKDEKTKEKK